MVARIQGWHMTGFPDRQSIRLKDYDYSSNGGYFVTICTRKRECLFDLVPALKKIVSDQWEKLTDRFPGIELDRFVVMPNHLHGIIFILDNGILVPENTGQKYLAGRGFSVKEPVSSSIRPTLGEIVGQYKRQFQKPCFWLI
jgi:hypothetical protein